MTILLDYTQTLPSLQVPLASPIAYLPFSSESKSPGTTYRYHILIHHTTYPRPKQKDRNPEVRKGRKEGRKEAAVLADPRPCVNYVRSDAF